MLIRERTGLSALPVAICIGKIIPATMTNKVTPRKTITAQIEINLSIIYKDWLCSEEGRINRPRHLYQPYVTPIDTKCLYVRCVLSLSLCIK